MADGSALVDLDDAPPPEAKGGIVARRKSDDTEMDITPMIDVTFLLLIFFIVASKLDQTASVELPPASFGGTVATQDSVVLTIDKGDTPDGPAAVYKGDAINPDAKIDSSDLEALEKEIEEYVAITILDDTRKRNVIIMAAKGVKHRDVARVAQAAARVADVQQLNVAVFEEQ